MLLSKGQTIAAMCILLVAPRFASCSPSCHSGKNKLFIPTSFVAALRGGASAPVAIPELSGEGSDAETLEISIPLSQAPALNQSRDEPLMRDIEMLSDILSVLVQQEDLVIHDLYEEFRQYGQQR